MARDELTAVRGGLLPRSLIFAFLLLIIAFGVGGALILARKEAPSSVVRAQLAGSKFAYTRAYARDEATAAGGLSDRLAFIASFPGFAPPRPDQRDAAPIMLTLTPRDDGLDPQERPAKLYARFLTPETFRGPGGLVLRLFEDSSPYSSEELLVAPPDGRAFFARCPRPQLGAPGEGCLSMFRMGAIDVELRYPAAYLDRWDALYDGARALLALMQRPSPHAAP